MVSDTLAVVLKAERSRFNARFAEARRLYPNLEVDAFQAFVTETLDPLIEAISAARPEAVPEVTWVAYEAGLELVGQQLAGPRAVGRHIETGWRELLATAAAKVCESPDQMIGGVSNALHNLAATPGVRPGLWISELCRLTTLCPDAATWLRVGQVLAWRVGLAHYRESALAVADGLGEALATEVLGSSPGSDWSAVRARLDVDPWFDPKDGLESEQSGSVPALRVARRVGGFRGFGGLFPEPPTVVTSGDRIVVLSDGDAWTLFADCFGATFHRTADIEHGAPSLDCGGHLELENTTVRLAKASLDLPELGRFTSAARTAHTLALTGTLSHAVVLVALS